jgi:dihydroorotate dehydrogenase electron transfer subunit
MKRIIANVISNCEIIPGIFLAWIKTPQIASIAQPGQFIMVSCGKETFLRRPLSIHQINGDKTSIAILFQRIGRGTHWLSNCKPDDKLDILGPLGNGFYINPTSSNLLLVGGGIGVAPLPFLAQIAIEMKYSVTMLLGATTAAQLYPHHLLPSAIDCVITTDDGTSGEKGFITNLLPKFLDWADQIFACGPSSMYKALNNLSVIMVKPVQISLETRMGCGFGLCYGCTIKTRVGLKQICKNGPVFELDEILWDEFVDI